MGIHLFDLHSSVLEPDLGTQRTLQKNAWKSKPGAQGEDTAWKILALTKPDTHQRNYEHLEGKMT